MIYIDPSVLPSLADTFRSCGELMSGIKQDLQSYMNDVSHKFYKQDMILAKRAEEAECELNKAKERQAAASKSYENATARYRVSTQNLSLYEEKESEIRSKGESYEGELENVERHIQNQQDEIEANQQYLDRANADLEQANADLQNAQSIYDDAQYKFEESGRIINEFGSLSHQFNAKLTAPKKKIKIDIDSTVYRYSIPQDYSIRTMLSHLSKDYINKVMAALDEVQQKVDAILGIGQQHFGCHIAPTGAVVSSTGGVGGGPLKNIVGSQTGSETFCPKCGQLKAICRCNEIVESTTKSYNKTREKIQELEQEAEKLKAKIDILQPLDSAANSLYYEADQIYKEKESLMREHSINESNINNYWNDRKNELVQAAWDDEKVYRSPEMNTLWDEVEGRRKANSLLIDKANQLDDQKKYKEWEARNAWNAQVSEEKRLGGTLEDFKREYNRTINKLNRYRKREERLKKMLRNYGVKLDRKGNIITNQDE